MTDTIDVFSDLVLHIPFDKRDASAAELKAGARDPWSFDAERSEEMRRNAVGDRQVLAFSRAPTDDLPAAGLSLWSHDEGLYVPNVVPLETVELTHAQYNAVLGDFADRVVRPVAARVGFRIELTDGRQQLSDWIPPEAARKLRVFSAAANKSTGSSHPMDRQRWFDFILAVHRSGSQLDTDRLARWLNEVDRWDEDSAYKLAGEFERYISILEYADTH
jgi:hypothetical protein